MIKTLIIDDEPLALQQLAAYVSKVPFLTLVGECQSALEARDIINSERVDAIFIDINMPDLNGMDFVQSLVAPPLVVFTTAYSEYAIDGYKVNAVDYLLKPFSLDDFRRAALRVKERYEHANTPLSLPTEPEPELTDENIFLKTEHKVVRVKIADIRYIEGMSEYLKRTHHRSATPHHHAPRHETHGGTSAVQLPTHTPLVHREHESCAGGDQEPHRDGCRHVSANRRYVQGGTEQLPRRQVSGKIERIFNSFS